MNSCVDSGRPWSGRKKGGLSTVVARGFQTVKNCYLCITPILVVFPYFKRSTKIVGKINISKAAGPDLIPDRMLNMLAPELAPIVHAIFTQSLDTGELPRDWSLANVAPIFKKGNRVLAENYRPVSLICITC